MSKLVSQESTQVKERIEKWVAEDTTAIVDLCSKLVQCKTPSEPGDTRSAAELIEIFLQQSGLPYEVLSQDETKPNILSAFQGSREGRHLMFNGHMDTMPAGNEPGWSDSPWSGKIEQERIWGRGTQDMKAGLTAMLFAYVYLARLSEELAGRVSISVVSDEETGLGRGTEFLFRTRPSEMRADCVLAAEPSGIDAISFSSKGYLQADILVETRGTIAGYDHESKSAIDIAADIVRDLRKISALEVEVAAPIRDFLCDADCREALKERRTADELFLIDAVTVDVTTIEGGDFAYTRAPSCRMSLAAVIPAGCDPYGVFCAIEQVVQAYPGVSIQLAGATAGEWSDPNAPIVAMLQDASEAFGGPGPTPIPDIAISDCRYWRYRGIPAFWYGPDGHLCSSADEHVRIEELLHLVRTYTLAAFNYLQQEAFDDDIVLNAEIEDEDALPISLWKGGKPNPSICELPSFRALCLEGRAKGFGSKQLDPAVDNLMERLLRLLEKENIFPGTTFAIMAPGKDEHGKFVHLTVGAPILNDHIESSELIEKVIISVEAAVCTHRGPSSTEQDWVALEKYARTLGRKVSGEYREDYLICDDGPASLWATKLVLPLKPLCG